ncbi:hypothetical protein MBLNU230_g6933t1 [Neophaeotheca triangularis]
MTRLNLSLLAALPVAYAFAAPNGLDHTQPPHGYATAQPGTPDAACGYPGGGPTAVVDAGTLVGTSTSLPAATASVNKFLGVPFAVSPPERFSPPQPAAPYGTIDATQFSAACIQQFNYPEATRQFTQAVFNNPPAEESEDCLYLNVYAPSTPAPVDGRSVLFWIYGGALQFGNAGQNTYDGSAFASYEDVIVVSANYRTNVFGFPSSPELPETGHNLGFLDQRLALDWVQRNIAAFGGSPDKVTLFGESAGAFSIDSLLTSFPANSTPPFRGAILQSGQYSYRLQAPESEVPQWNQLAAGLGCPGNYSSNLTCVRAAPATEVKRIIETQRLTFDPNPDGVTLVQNPAAQRLSGDIAKIPVLGGTNAQEGRVFAVGTTNATTFLLGYFGQGNAGLVADLLAAYPNGTEYDRGAAVFTDLIFTCAQSRWANDSAALGIPTWRYYYNASFANTQAFPNLGVYHASEIPIVFGTYLKENVTTQEYALSNSMQSAWARFAKNPARGPGWNPVGTGQLGSVLVGASEQQPGGIYLGGDGEVLEGAFDLAVLGNRNDVPSGGVTVIASEEVDVRCGLYNPLYEFINSQR